MKVKEITVEQKKQVKQYEPVSISVTASITDKDDVNTRVDEVREFINFKLNREKWDAEYEKFKEELTVEGLSEDNIKQRKDYISRYESYVAKIEGFDWLQ